MTGYGTRDFSVGEVIGGGFSILARNIAPFMLLAVVIYAPLIVYRLAILSAASTTLIVIDTLLDYLLATVLTAAVTAGTVQELNGQRPGLGDIIGQGFARVLPLMGASLLAVTAIGLGFVALVVPGFILWTILWVVVPVAVNEGLGPIGSLSRSAELTKGYRWQIFGILVIIIIISAVVSLILGFVFGFSAVELDTPRSLSGAVILDLVISVLFGAFYAVVTAVGYYLLRIAKEGVDISRLAMVFD
jgi:hypothetical protein